MTRIFCDANVVFSASITPNGRAAALIDLANSGRHRLLVSRHVIGEVRSNLIVRYPGEVERFQEILTMFEVVPESAPALLREAQQLGLPPEDAPVLAAAIGCRAELLVTGDRRHFGDLWGRRIKGVRVMSLKDALATLL